jgi:LCP family protein required for cell wall assembly
VEYDPRDRRPSRPWQEESLGAPSRSSKSSARPRGEPPRGGRPAEPRRSATSSGTQRPLPARARQEPPPRSRPARPRPASPPPRKRSRLAPKIAAVLVSLLAMGLTGYGWAAKQGLVNSLNYTDVIDSQGGGEKPADGAVDILLVGMDSRTDADGNPLSPEVLAQLKAGESDGELNTDSLIFVHIPNDGSKAVAVSMPRDSYVDIPGFGKNKINSAYARGVARERADLAKQNVKDTKEVAQKTAQAGAKVLIATVSALTGSTIDHYAAINLLGFNDITKAIGGVDVCLKNNVKDDFSGANFTKGPHTVSGVEALEFVRQRHGLPGGDLDRVVRQQVFMAGMAKKMLSAGTLADPTKLGDLTAAIKKSVVIDQNWDIFAFAQQMKGLTGGQLEFRTIPVVNVDYRTPDGESAIQVDPKAVHAFVQGVAGDPSKTAPPVAPAPKGITVDVRNASGKDGLAASVEKDLTSQGYTAGDTANSASRKSTVVRVPTGQTTAGKTLADALGSKATVEVDKTVTAGHALVFLGSDYSGGAAPPSSTQAASAAQPGAAAPAPITANGVTCVN